MEGIVYLNGEFVPADEARISPFDRGFIYADGVYEVVRYYRRKPFAMAEHLERLDRSLGDIRLSTPVPVERFAEISDTLVERNGLANATVYWQVTRGPAPRSHAFPDRVNPTAFAFAQPAAALNESPDPHPPLTAITHDEIRWARCGVKSVSLLGNVLAMQAAVEAGADEAILVRPDGTVTEGTARSILAVIDGTLRTHPLDGSVLGSITRQQAIAYARAKGIAVDERAFTVDQMLAAEELIAAGTTTELRTIASVDGRTVGGGVPGPIATRLYHAYQAAVRRQCF